jgi:hypothetical protein
MLDILENKTSKNDKKLQENDSGLETTYKKMFDYEKLGSLYKKTFNEEKFPDISEIKSFLKNLTKEERLEFKKEYISLVKEQRN